MRYKTVNTLTLRWSKYPEAIENLNLIAKELGRPCTEIADTILKKLDISLAKTIYQSQEKSDEVQS